MGQDAISVQGVKAAAQGHEQADVTRGVCIIDDNRDLCRMLQAFLEHEPHISWALGLSDWHTAVQEVRRRGPAIVLLDLQLNGANGLDLLEPLRDACPSAQVVILSGSVSVELIESALDLGAWGFICKCTDVEEIVRLIGRVAHGEIALCPRAQETLGNV